MSADTILAASRLLAPGGVWIGPAAAVISGGRITEILDHHPPGADLLSGGVLTPGSAGPAQ